MLLLLICCFPPLVDTTLMEDADFITKIGAARRSQAGDNRKLTDGHDIHVIACTLKLYFRELRESPIPAEMYLEALEAAHSPASACALLERLPRVNRRVLRYLIKFLQVCRRLCLPCIETNLPFVSLDLFHPRARAGDQDGRRQLVDGVGTEHTAQHDHGDQQRSHLRAHQGRDEFGAHSHPAPGHLARTQLL